MSRHVKLFCLNFAADNRQRDERPEKQQEYELLLQDERKSTLPNQLAFAAFQFLTTSKLLEDSEDDSTACSN